MAGESGQYLLGAVEQAVLSNSNVSQVKQGLDYPIFHLIHWGNHLFLFPYYSEVKIYDSNFECVSSTGNKFRGTASWGVHSNEKHLYFSNSTNGIVQVDKTLQEKVVKHTKILQDFFVCPKTETITTIESGKEPFTARLLQGDHELQMNICFEKSEFHILKKMYSDHFLVGETARAGRRQAVIYLVDSHTLTLKTYHNWTSELTLGLQNIRLLAPRQGISCFLVAMRNSLELFCEYRLKLYHLKTLEIKVNCFGLSNLMDDLWLLACDQHTILSVRVDFSKCPALQL